MTHPARKKRKRFILPQWLAGGGLSSMRLLCRRPWVIKRCFLLMSLLPLCLVSLFLLLNTGEAPASFQTLPLHHHPVRPSMCLKPSQFDIINSHSNCFPRVQGLCFYNSQVKICNNVIRNKSIKGPVITPSEACSYYTHKQCNVPSLMRFNGERVTLPVAQSSLCTHHESRWITGLAMVADQRFLPHGKPNPHHEAEKLIPALFMLQMVKLVTNTSLYWFSGQQELSKWATGFLKATGMDKSVQFLQLPKERELPLCFEDVVIFSPPTNLWYIPGNRENQWLREKALQHCSIPSSTEQTSRPVKTATILDRYGGARHFANREQVALEVHRVLNVTVKQAVAGAGSFCDQVQAVVNEDLVIVPHGSQNTNLIFARPGTIVIEVFPYLYYTDALRNLTNAAGLQVYAILGQRPQQSLLMWIFSFLGWDFCFFHFRWCKNYARQQPIVVDINELEKILFHIGRGYINQHAL